MAYHDIVELTEAIKDYTDRGDSAQEVLTKSAVGWAGKNEIPVKFASQEINGVTITVDADGVITANGTASGNISIWTPDFYVKDKNYVLSGTTNATNNKQLQVYAHIGSTDFGEPHINEVSGGGLLSSTNPVRVRLYIASGTVLDNEKFYPMLRDANIKDSTFEPHHESVEECKLDIEAQKIAGAVNLFKYTRSTETKNTVVFTVNSDLSVTAVGTNDSDDYIRLDVLTDNYFNGTYKAVGCPYGWGNDPIKAMVVFREDSGSGTSLGEDRGEGVIFTTNNHRINVRILVAPHAVLNGTFKIMITPVLTATYNDYVPYAMTNKELTDKKISTADLKTVTAASSDFADFKTRIAAL